MLVPHFGLRFIEEIYPLLLDLFRFHHLPKRLPFNEEPDRHFLRDPGDFLSNVAI